MTFLIVEIFDIDWNKTLSTLQFKFNDNMNAIIEKFFNEIVFDFLFRKIISIVTKMSFKLKKYNRSFSSIIRRFKKIVSFFEKKNNKRNFFRRRKNKHYLRHKTLIFEIKQRKQRLFQITSTLCSVKKIEFQVIQSTHRFFFR